MSQSFLLIALAFIGLAVSGYIFYKKSRKEPLFCLLGKDCSFVFKSSYSYIINIPNEILGFFYYLIVILVALILLFSEDYLRNFVRMGFILAAFAASFYSLYLTYVQLFVLKKICEYCLLANLSNLLIFLTALL